MATPLQFARRIRLLGRRVRENTDRLVRETAVVLNQAVVVATPVDTGRARANWQAAIDSPITEEVDEEDKVGQATMDRNNGVISTRKEGQDIVLSNNVSYIGFLNEGSSAKAPAMFIEIAVAEAEEFLRKRKGTIFNR